jgi:hypothetical protein
MAAADDTPKDAEGKVIPGFEKNKNDPNAAKGWQPGFGPQGPCRHCRIWALQIWGGILLSETIRMSKWWPATDLDPGRCAALAKAVGAKKTYPSCEEMIKDKSIEAVYIATDAPSHARLAIMALEHGKHALFRGSCCFWV